MPEEKKKKKNSCFRKQSYTVDHNEKKGNYLNSTLKHFRFSNAHTFQVPFLFSLLFFWMICVSAEKTVMLPIKVMESGKFKYRHESHTNYRYYS